VLSSAAAPVLLVGGWTVAARLQPSGTYDPVVRTISDLAAHGATDRWLMTGALLGLGGCHLATALALAPAAVAGRVGLALGGVATMVVAAAPLPADGSGSPVHTAAASVAFLALAAWPAAAVRGSAAEWVVRPAVGLGAAAGLLAVVGWFGVELAADSQRVGLAERVAAGAQALWPLVVVVAARAVDRTPRVSGTRGSITPCPTLLPADRAPG
jgi:hypothetical membrane protein